MRQINRIFLHHSESPFSTTFEDIKQWHLNRGWRDIGYHFVIGQYGTIKIGRPVSKIGAGVYHHNNDSIHICVIGDFDKRAPKTKQIESLISLLTRLRMKHDVKIHNHCEYTTNKTCPGRNLAGMLSFLDKESKRPIRRLIEVILILLEKIKGDK